MQGPERRTGIWTAAFALLALYAAHPALCGPDAGGVWRVSALLLIGLAAAALARCCDPSGCLGLKRLPVRPGQAFAPLLLLASFNLIGAFPVPLRGSAGAVLILLPAAFAEELIFRGFFYTAAERSFGARAAVLLSSLAFAACHAGFPPQALRQSVFALAWGLVLAETVCAFGSLWPCVAAHAAVNAFSLLSAGTPEAEKIILLLTMPGAAAVCVFLHARGPGRGKKKAREGF